MNQINQIRTVVPPHMLKAIEENGTPKQQGMAREMLISREIVHESRMLAPSRIVTTPTDEAAKVFVYDAEGGFDFPGRLITHASAVHHLLAPVDQAADEARKGAIDFLRYQKIVLGRDSIDGKGGPIICSVHVGGKGYGNAFWDGVGIRFGDGDGEIFNPLTGGLDVIGHELFHGVSDDSGLNYQDMSGAILESWADVMACCFTQWVNGERPDQGAWLIGEDIFTPGIDGDALRNLRLPGHAYGDDLVGRDPQPAHMKDYDPTKEDHGGVHINSGILNRAGCLMALTMAVKSGLHSWQTVGKIWYDAMDELDKPDCSFGQWASATIESAELLFDGRETDAAIATREAWRSVGVVTE